MISAEAVQIKALRRQTYLPCFYRRARSVSPRHGVVTTKPQPTMRRKPAILSRIIGIPSTWYWKRL